MNTLMHKAGNALAPGNVDLANRPVSQGSTVRSMSIGTPQGEVLIPTVREDGWLMSEKEAIDYYRKTGRHLGIFRSPEEANSFARALHDEQERMYRP
jgi:hypothetical protein